jgi:hypothetical protein
LYILFFSIFVIGYNVVTIVFVSSFVIGFGKNYPKYPHHSSSSCPDAPAPCDWDNFESPEPNVHVLEGALVGGPDGPDDKAIFIFIETLVLDNILLHVFYSIAKTVFSNF